MKITHQLAQQIVDRTIRIIGKNINIMDENGYIVGTGDRSRLNKYHEGAALVIKNKEKMFIYPENKESLIGVKPGVNLPIEDNNRLIGVVGITGNPDEVGPFGGNHKNDCRNDVTAGIFIKRDSVREAG